MNNYITYGYRLVDGQMEMDPGRAEMVHLIFDTYDKGESIRQITKMLKDQKVPSTHGEPSWSPSLTRKVLNNRDYLGTELYPQMIENELFGRVQERLKCSRDVWNQRHPSGSVQGTSMYTGRLICSSCGGVYSIYKQSKRNAKRNARYWKCRHYDTDTGAPCKMPIMTEKQLDEMFLCFLTRIKTEPALYHEETERFLDEMAVERQLIESELDTLWNRDSRDYGRMEQLYFLITTKRYQEIRIADLTSRIEKYLQSVGEPFQAESLNSSVFQIIKRVVIQPDRSIKFELINYAVIHQRPERRKRNKNPKNPRYCVPFGYWLDEEDTPIIHEQYGPIVQQLFQSYAHGISLTALAKELEHQSIPNQKGKPAWSHSCISNILTNHIYLGDDKFPALVTREQFIQVQDRLEETSRMKRESRTRISTGKEGANAKNGTNCGDHPGNLGPGG